MHLDVSTAMLVTSALTLAVGASLAVAVTRYPDRLRQAMHIWIGGLLLQIPVFLLFGIAGALPGVPAIVVANALFAFAYAEMGRAVRVFAGSDARSSRFELAIIAVLIVIPIVFGFIWPDPRWRLALGAPLLAVLSLHVAYSILRRDGPLRAADWLTGGLFILSAVPMLLRAVIEIAAPLLDIEPARAFGRNLFFLTGSCLPMIATIGFLLMCNDRINDELKRLAMLDPLTGLFNRRTFEERAQLVIDEAERGLYPLSLLAVDIDHFKLVNDEFGHAGGDEALRLVVALMQETLAEGQILSRIGGEEFAVLLPGSDEDEATAIAEGLRQHLESHAVDVEGRELCLKISAGVATLGPGLETLSTLLRAADRALYAAKRAGRNRVATSSALAATG
ncbi:MAG TPA: GGDEF domain-containing protein [Rhodanobacteraceae bacterium]|nr:GGDEF domain-containing protein [Rhodanobacteraceae bacterium]